VRRRLLNLLTALSMLLCVAVAVLWVRSYGSVGSLPPEIPRGGTVFINCRGQLLLVHHAANAEPSGRTPAERIASLRVTWGTTTARLSGGPGCPQVLIKALVFDPDAAWDTQDGLPRTILSRPYVFVPVAEGCTAANGFGFAARSAQLPTAGVPPKHLALWQRIGTVVRVLGVPHWFLLLVTAALPAQWLRRHHRRTGGRRRPGLCLACGYDLRATPRRCPECGRSPKVA